MRQHGVPRDIDRVPRNVKVVVLYPVVHIVVLPAPAPERIREPVQRFELLPCQRGDSAENRRIRQFVLEHVDANGHVPGLFRARVKVPVVLRQEIDVVKDEAVEVAELQRFLEPDVHEHRSVERVVSLLFDDEDRVFDLLLFKERVHVLDEEEELLGAGPVRDDYSDVVVRLALGRGVVSSELQPFEFFIQFGDVRHRGFLHVHFPDQAGRDRRANGDRSCVFRYITRVQRIVIPVYSIHGCCRVHQHF